MSINLLLAFMRIQPFLNHLAIYFHSLKPLPSMAIAALQVIQGICLLRVLIVSQKYELLILLYVYCRAID